MKRFVDFSFLTFPSSTIALADWSRPWMIIEQSSSSSSTDREEWTRLWHTSDWTNTSIAWEKQWIIKEKKCLGGLVEVRDEEQQRQPRGRSRAVGNSLIPFCLSHRGNKKQRLRSTHQERLRENRCSTMTSNRVLYLFSRFLSVEQWKGRFTRHIDRTREETLTDERKHNCQGNGRKITLWTIGKDKVLVHSFEH